MTDEFLAFLKAWEGPPSLSPRRDPVASGPFGISGTREVYDIGYGHVCPPDHPPISLERAEAMLAEDAEERAEQLRAFVPEWLSAHQADALLSFAFNVGVTSLRKSTLLQCVKNGDDDGAAFQFSRWNKAGGKVVRGLTKRRAAEAAMFLNADYGGRP